MNEVWLAVVVLGIGLGIVGIAFLRAISLSNQAGKWEKDFYRIRDELKFKQEQDQFKDAQAKRMQDELENHKKKSSHMGPGDDFNELFSDAPASNPGSDSPEHEKTTNSDDEEGVL